MAEQDKVKIERGKRKVLTATVVSNKMDKTLVAMVARTAAHPLYRKVVKITSKCYVHDEKNEAQVGDTIEIMETRPLSKLKRWRLVRIIRHAESD